MKKILSPVFQGIDEAEWEEMEQSACLRERAFGRNELIFKMGDTTTALGIVLSGSVIIRHTDVWGNTGVLAKIEPGDAFAEAYALSGMPMQVEAAAQESSRILFLDLFAADTGRSADADWHRKLMKNLLVLSAGKNITLSERMSCISSKTVRGRVLAFLSGQAMAAGSNTIRIPFDRQQMADYLNVDRTALSKELGKMRDEGLITFHRNEFTIRSTEV